MFTSLAKLLTFFRARWRWARGHCPRCNRHLHAAFPNYMADDPNCPVCKAETETDLHVWHTYRSLGDGSRTKVVESTRAGR
jgi:hypothetical protein